MPFASSAHASAMETGSRICERCGAPCAPEDWLCAHCGLPLRADRQAAVRAWLRAAHQQLESLNSALAWLLLICWAAFPLVVLGISVAGEPHWSKWLVGVLLAGLTFLVMSIPLGSLRDAARKRRFERDILPQLEKFAQEQGLTLGELRAAAREELKGQKNAHLVTYLDEISDWDLLTRAQKSTQERQEP